MMKNIPFLIIFFLVLSCSGSEKTTDGSVSDIEVRQLDTLVVRSDDPVFEEPADTSQPEVSNTLPVYQSTHRRTTDILHTDLDLSFAWENKSLICTPELTLTPYLYTIQQLVLDAKNFDIQSIKRKEN